MPEPRFKARTPNLERLFAGEWPLRTDVYQRDYAWEKDQLSDFIGDVKELYRRRIDGVEDPSHFFGAIVAIQEERNDYLQPLYWVLDGQQRLATFSIAIASVIAGARAASKLVPEDERHPFEQFTSAQTSAFIWGVDPNKTTYEDETRRKFKVSLRDESVFARLLKGPEDPDEIETNGRYSEGLLVSAYKQLSRDLITPLIDADPRTTLRHLGTLRQAMGESAEFVFIFTKSRHHAHELFSVLNDRGRGLEEADLLRSYSLMLASRCDRPDQARVAEAWDGIDRLPRTTVDGFLRHNYASVVGDRVSSDVIARRYKSAFFRNLDRPVPEDAGAQLVATVEGIRDSMRLYDPLSRGEWPIEERAGRRATPRAVRDRLFRVTQALGSDRVLPLLLAAAHRGSKDLATLVLRLDMLEFRSLLSGVEANKMAGFYMDLAALLRSGAYDIRRVVSELEVWLGAWATDADFEKGLRELQYGQFRAGNYIKHLLTSIEDHIGWLDEGGTGPPRTGTRPWDFGQIDDDHVYPQNPDGGLPASWDSLVNRLGNQTIWWPIDNVEMSNALPTDATKVQAYRNTSAPQITQRIGADLEATGKWDDAEISARENQLVAQALMVYQADPATNAATAITTGRSRPKQFLWRAPGERKVHLLFLDRDSSVSVTDGEFLDLGFSAGARNVAAGDAIILCASKVLAAPRKGITGHPPRATGFLEVDKVEYLANGGRRAHAVVGSWYILDPTIPLASLNQSEGTRSGRQVAFRIVDEAYVSTLDSLRSVMPDAATVGHDQ